MKVNLNFNLKELDGKEIPNANVGKTLANFLANASNVDSLKFMDWATKLDGGKELDLDQSDLQTLKNYVENHQQMVALIKAPILNVLLNSK